MNSSEIEADPLNVPMNIVPISTREMAYRILGCILGIIINATIIATVIASRQLHYPRHIYWAGISTAYFTSIAQQFNDTIGNYYGARIACQLYVLYASVPYTVVSLFLMSAAFDRLFALTRYEWYKRRVTNRRVITLLISVYLITVAGTTSPFWTGYQQIEKCTVNMTHMYYVMTVNITTAIVCVYLHVKIFVVSRAVIRKYPRQPPVVTFSKRLRSVSSQGDQAQHYNNAVTEIIFTGPHAFEMMEVSGKYHGAPRQSAKVKLTNKVTSVPSQGDTV